MVEMHESSEPARVRRVRPGAKVGASAVPEQSREKNRVPNGREHETTDRKHAIIGLERASHGREHEGSGRVRGFNGRARRRTIANRAYMPSFVGRSVSYTSPTVASTLPSITNARHATPIIGPMMRFALLMVASRQKR
jgi:hypothetical protein